MRLMVSPFRLSAATKPTRMKQFGQTSKTSSTEAAYLTAIDNERAGTDTAQLLQPTTQSSPRNAAITIAAALASIV
jgi:hypothetical protein